MKLSELDGCFYAGIGARKTPKEICVLMKEIASKLSIKYNFILRSGGAEGADSAFELGSDLADGKKEIFLPWNHFNNKHANNTSTFKIYNKEIIDKSTQIAAKFHPKWEVLTVSSKSMMIRNNFQVLGANLNSLSKFILCWTPDGRDSGGTGQALRVAKAYGIKIENLYNKKTFDKWSEWVKK